jgi:hypothetical protein
MDKLEEMLEDLPITFNVVEPRERGFLRTLGSTVFALTAAGYYLFRALDHIQRSELLDLAAPRCGCGHPGGVPTR